MRGFCMLLLSLFVVLSVCAGTASSKSNAPTSKTTPTNGPDRGDPVGLADGVVYDAVTDLRVCCQDIDLVFRRSYGSWSQRRGSLGVGWTHSYDWRVEADDKLVCVFSSAETGVTDGVHKFAAVEPGGRTFNDEGYELRRSADGRFSVVTPERMAYFFDERKRLDRIETWNGTAVQLTRDARFGAVVRADHSDGKSLMFELDADGMIVRVTSPNPSVWVECVYSDGPASARRLIEVIRHDGLKTSAYDYEYEPVGRPGTMSPSDAAASAGTAFEPYRFLYGTVPKATVPSCDPRQAKARAFVVMSRKTDPNMMSTFYRYIRLSDDVHSRCIRTEMTGGLVAYDMSYGLNSTRVTCETAFGTVSEWFAFDKERREIASGVDGGESRHMRYDLRGDLVRTEVRCHGLPHKRTSVYAYDSRHRVVSQASALDAEPSRRWGFAWDDLSGELRRSVSPAGRVSEWMRGDHRYDVFGAGINDHRLVSFVSCDGRWRPLSVVDADGCEARFAYGADGLVSRVEVDGLPAVDVGYDALGNISAISRPGPDAEARTVCLSNNWKGRPLSVSYPDGTSESFAYDGNGTKIVRHIDQLGREDVYRWVLGLPVHAERVAGGAKNTLFGVEHDRQLNVVRITDPLGRAAESYALDANDRVVAVTNVEGQAMTRAYALGELVASETRFDGTTVSYGYDKGGNLSSAAYPDETLSFAYDADGLCTAASNSVGIVANVYDPSTGWLDASRGADGTWVEYARSDGGSVTSVTSVAGTTAYALDAAGRRTHVSTQSAAFDFGYCEWNGRLSAVTNACGFMVQYAHDTMDRVTNIAWRTTSGALLGGFSYEYDALGRIVSRSHVLGAPFQPSPMSQSFQKTYAYDDFDHLASDGDVAYTYDAAGNRMTRTENGETITYTLGVGDRLASYGRAASTMPPHSGAYFYDTAGNVTRIERDGRPTLDLVWNSQYQLVSVSTNGVFAESYTYDALGRRVSTTTPEGTTRHVYDNNWQCIGDIDENGDVVASYVWGEGIDKLLAVTIGGATYYALTDIQGTVWGYVDSQNNIVARWQYDAWGGVVDEEVSVLALARLRYRFQGREWSAATGLINFRMRWYDAKTGRWLSKDPIGLSGGLNLYGFCACSPLIKNDAWGLLTFQLGVSGTGGAGNGGTVGVGFAVGYSAKSGFQFGVYGMVGDGAYISKGGGVAIDATISLNDDICDLNGVSQSIGGSGTTPIGAVGGELGFPLPWNDGPLPLPSLTGSWGWSTPLPEVHTFTTATGIHEIWRSR